MSAFDEHGHPAGHARATLKPGGGAEIRVGSTRAVARRVTARNGLPMTFVASMWGRAAGLRLTYN
ncbi:MAG: hypothetical protein JWQ18_2948 [Conexibacter sp.]|nr:hypothetical protein [Conexibacter sp.]